MHWLTLLMSTLKKMSDSFTVSSFFSAFSWAIVIIPQLPTVWSKPIHWYKKPSSIHGLCTSLPRVGSHIPGKPKRYEILLAWYWSPDFWEQREQCWKQNKHRFECNHPIVGSWSQITRISKTTLIRVEFKTLDWYRSPNFWEQNKQWWEQ